VCSRYHYNHRWSNECSRRGRVWNPAQPAQEWNHCLLLCAGTDHDVSICATCLTSSFKWNPKNNDETVLSVVCMSTSSITSTQLARGLLWLKWVHSLDPGWRTPCALTALPLIVCVPLQVGGAYSYDCSFGYIPNVELMKFISLATFGSYLPTCPDVDLNSQGMNTYHKAFLTYSFLNTPESMNSEYFCGETAMHTMKS